MDKRKKKLIEMGKELSVLFPNATVQIRRSVITPNEIEVTIQTDGQTYNEAMSLMTTLGVKDKHKNPTTYFTAISGYIFDQENPKIRVMTLTNELPPTCRVETYKEKVHKTCVTTCDNEFVEVERKRVVCDGGHEE